MFDCHGNKKEIPHPTISMNTWNKEKETNK